MVDELVTACICGIGVLVTLAVCYLIYKVATPEYSGNDTRDPMDKRSMWW